MYNGRIIARKWLDRRLKGRLQEVRSLLGVACMAGLCSEYPGEEDMSFRDLSIYVIPAWDMHV